MAFKTISLTTLLVFIVKEFSYATSQDLVSFMIDSGTRNLGLEKPGMCTTNTGSRGKCVSSLKCATIPSLISSNPSKLCGWDGLEKLICCPLQNPNPAFPLPAECVAMPQGLNNSRIKRYSPQGGATPFVVDGVDAKVGDWPFMAALFLSTDDERRKPFCGGALISSAVVLTAAHCFISHSPEMGYIVTMGVTNLITGDSGVIPTLRHVSKVIVHENYEYPVMYHDIAILKLSRTVVFTGSAKPICLPYSAISKQDFAGQTATIIGWGNLAFGGAAAKTLQVAEVPITTNLDCESSYRNFDIGLSLPHGVPNNVICAGSESSNKDTCQGDSGGPLVVKDPRGNKAILIGIVSTGIECGRGLPGFYTRVTQYLNWIAENSR